jgi:hypothetical protein
MTQKKKNEGDTTAQPPEGREGYNTTPTTLLCTTADDLELSKGRPKLTRPSASIII